MAGAAAALYGPLHGGANEAVLRMLTEIGTVQNIPGFIKRVKAGEGRLMGFGHRVYKSYDPRAKIIKQTADEVFEVTGKNPLLDIALELERIALEDEYFVTRKLYPNVDFYSGLIYQAMGFPVTMFPVLFAIPRTSGWIAQWEEMLLDPEQKIARPQPGLHRSRATGLRAAQQAGISAMLDFACRCELCACVDASVRAALLVGAICVPAIGCTDTATAIAPTTIRMHRQRRKSHRRATRTSHRRAKRRSHLK